MVAFNDRKLSKYSFKLISNLPLVKSMMIASASPYSSSNVQYIEPDESSNAINSNLLVFKMDAYVMSRVLNILSVILNV